MTSMNMAWPPNVWGSVICPLCGAPSTGGHACALAMPQPRRRCEHCFCTDVMYGVKPHVSCCMCFTRKLKDEDA